ncbi:MAG: Ig-like domain-containing protein [Gemmatimonadaceae bacterium]|nr:Ig-like domain-containing protein [Gemmatimonadaceae bacterium]
MGGLTIEGTNGMRVRAMRWRQACTSLVLAALSACGGGGGDGGIVRPPPTTDPITVTIAPAAVPNLDVGATTQLAATVNGGAASIVRTVTWTSSADAIIRVSSSGLVTAVAPGQAVITAASDADRTRTAQVTVIVNAPSVTGITLNAAAGVLLVGQTTTVTATVTATGQGTNTRVRFSSNSPQIATVSTTDGRVGTVTAVGRGEATITATSELDATRSATVTIRVNETRVAGLTVTPVNDSVAVSQALTLVATARDSSGNALTGRPITWTSSATNVATVSPSGVVTGVAPGVATITASVPLETGSATVLTAQAQVRVVSGLRLAIAPRSATLRPFEAQTFTASVTGGPPSIDRTVELISRSPAVASVAAGGVVTGVAPGTARIIARMRVDTLVRDSVTVTVIDPCSVGYAHVLGTTTNGLISTGSCRIDQGGATSLNETIIIDTPQPASFLLRYQASLGAQGVSNFYVPYPASASTAWFYPDISATQAIRAVVHVPAGRYFAEAIGRQSATGTFQFQTSVSPDPTQLCGIDQYAAPGTTFTVVLGGTCTTVNVFGILRMAAGVRLRARATALGFPASIRLCDANLNCATTPLANGVAAAAGATAVADFVNGAAGSRFWFLQVGSPVIGAVGAIQVTIDP